jgi:hypothetical protein
MKIKMWGGQSQVEIMRNNLIKELSLLDKAIEILSNNDELRFDYVKIISGIESVQYTGDFVILDKNNKKVCQIPKKYESLLKLYGVPKI